MGLVHIFLEVINYKNSFIKEHLIIPAQDVPYFNLTRYFQKGIDFIHKNRQKYNVFIHCFAGISRSATILIAYMISKLHYSLNESLRLCKTKRNVVNPNYGFISQLKQFERKFKKQEKDKIRIIPKLKSPTKYFRNIKISLNINNRKI